MSCWRRIGEELSQSRFEPAAFELSIREGGEVEPLVLRTAARRGNPCRGNGGPGGRRGDQRAALPAGARL